MPHDRKGREKHGSSSSSGWIETSQQVAGDARAVKYGQPSIWHSQSETPLPLTPLVPFMCHGMRACESAPCSFFCAQGKIRTPLQPAKPCTRSPGMACMLWSASFYDCMQKQAKPYYSQQNPGTTSPEMTCVPVGPAAAAAAPLLGSSRLATPSSLARFSNRLLAPLLLPSCMPLRGRPALLPPPPAAAAAPPKPLPGPMLLLLGPKPPPLLLPKLGPAAGTAGAAQDTCCKACSSWCDV